jgi:hypothetical protein
MEVVDVSWIMHLVGQLGVVVVVIVLGARIVSVLQLFVHFL